MTDDEHSDDIECLADRFEQCRDDEPSGHNPAVFGKVGTGKTHQIGTELARRVGDNAETVEWIDPKDEREGEENGG